MADLTELKQMVMSFRVSELHVLLGFAGRNKSGRKQELTQRALALVQKGCSLPVQIKIRELFRQINAEAKNLNSLSPHKEGNMPVMHRHPGMVGFPADPPGASSGDFPKGGTLTMNVDFFWTFSTLGHHSSIRRASPLLG